jgi:hypothetical protein
MKIDLRKLLQKLTASSAALLALTFGSLAYGQLAPPEQLVINNLTWAGSGCPPGSVAGSVSDDNLAFTLAFSKYQAQIPPGSLARKNCTLVLDLAIPQGWTVTIFKVNYVGFTQLLAGTNARQSSTYKWEGQSQIASLSSSWSGPVTVDPYHFTDTIGLEALVWSRCGVDRNLLINTSISISGKEGIITTDTIDGELKETYGLSWKKCPA